MPFCLPPFACSASSLLGQPSPTHLHITRSAQPFWTLTSVLGLLLVCSSMGVFSAIRAATRGSVNSKLTPRKRNLNGNRRPRLLGNEATSIFHRRKTTPLKRRVVFSLTEPRHLAKSPLPDKRLAGDNAGRLRTVFLPTFLSNISRFDRFRMLDVVRRRIWALVRP